MAKWNDLPWREDVYKAAEQSRETCFFNDGSIFDHGNIWTTENFLTLEKRVIRLNLNGGNFWKRFRQPIDEAPHETYILAAEVMWLLRLFPIGVQHGEKRHSKILVSTKQNNIKEILQWGRIEFPKTQLLDERVLSGIGSPSTANITDIPYMQVYLIRLMSAWKQLTLAQKAATFDTNNPKIFAEFADKFLKSDLYTQGKAEPIRHALLFFLSPDYFERMVSIKDRKNIVGHFKNLLSDTTKNQLHKNIKKNKPLLIDQAIFEIRQSLESAYPQDSVDFYREPIQVSGSWVSVEEVQRRLAENNKSTPSTEANHLPQTVTEGEQRFYQYYGKSRKALRKPKLESFRKQHGFLFCECCDDRGGRYPAKFGQSNF